MRFRPNSLFVMLLLPLAGAVLALTVAVTSAGGCMMRRALISRAQARGEAIASAQHDVIVRAMRTGAHGDLQGLLEDIGRNPDIAVVRLLRPDGVVRASSMRDQVGWKAVDHLSQRDARGDYLPQPSDWWLGQGVVHNARSFRNGPECQSCHAREGPVIAHLDLDIAVNQHRTGSTAFGTLSLLLGVFYFVAVVGIAVPTLSLIVVRPMLRLNRALRRVESGDLSTEVEPTGTREVDSVVHGFNHMVQRLRHGDAAEKEAQRLQMERAEQLAAVGQMAAGLAHEIRNPLSSVRAVLEVVAQDTASGEARGILREAAGELDRLDQIVRDLLQYARPRAPAVLTFDLNDLVGEVAGFTLARTVSAGGTLHVELWSESLPVVADPDMVRQVLVNLLLNAQQAVPAGTVPAFSVSTGARNGHAWCRVRDSGPGIPADRAAAVFQPFMTTKARGTGLGLSISRRVMEVQGGSLALDNAGEPGASFTFTLPLATRPAETGPDVRPQDPDR
jgi:signal transduction histidine kinase